MPSRFMGIQLSLGTVLGLSSGSLQLASGPAWTKENVGAYRLRKAEERKASERAAQEPEQTVSPEESASPGKTAPASAAPWFGKRPSPSESTVYTRAIGSEDPRSKAKYVHRELTPEEKAHIDQIAEQYKKNPRAAHLSPMGVALEVDAPVHRIAHRLETVHGINTIPREGTMREAPDTYHEWMDDYARRMREHDAGVHFFPEDEDLENESRKLKAREAERLAKYARAGVISSAKAAEGASHLSVNTVTGHDTINKAQVKDKPEQRHQISDRLHGWESHVTAP